ncbi:MAG: hypothetical protein ACRDF8_00755 [Chloroflexota bacterium]
MRKLIDHAASLGMAREFAQREAEEDRLWVREHLKSFACGVLCTLMTVMIIAMLWYGLARG